MVVAALICAGVLAASICVYWIVFLQPLYFGFPGWSIFVSNVGWSVKQARAEFYLTLKFHQGTNGHIALSHVEVNGTRVDAYPEDLTLIDGETALLRVYFPYEHNQTYEFVFFDVAGNGFKFVGQSPSQ